MKLRSVPMGHVQWTDGFWADRFELCRTAMLPTLHSTLLDPKCSAQLNRLKFSAGLIDKNPGGVDWADGDCYKWIEAMAHVHSVRPDSRLGALMDEWIAVIAKAQRQDGYISVNMTGRERWKNCRDHETYNMGHLMTAACAHHQATGKTALLDIAIRATDYHVLQWIPLVPRIDDLRHSASSLRRMGRSTGRRYAPPDRSV